MSNILIILCTYTIKKEKHFHSIVIYGTCFKCLVLTYIYYYTWNFIFFLQDHVCRVLCTLRGLHKIIQQMDVNDSLPPECHLGRLVFISKFHLHLFSDEIAVDLVQDFRFICYGVRKSFIFLSHLSHSVDLSLFVVICQQFYILENY